MKRSLSIVISVSVFLTTIFSLPISADNNNPCEFRNFSGLNLTDAFMPSLSSDGNFVVFYSNAEPETVSIWVAMSNGTDRGMLYRNTSINSYFTRPKFSPDGEKIVFVCKGVAVFERNGPKWDKNATVSFLNVSGSAPSFSPDRTKIIYESTEGEDGMVTYGDVWVMNMDGTSRTRLTFEKDGGGSPSYSPDGVKIVYERLSDRGETELWVMNSDGTDQKRILSDSWYPHHPVFMPNGKILFESARVSPHSNKEGAPSIWMMEQDGSNRTLLVPSVISSVGSMNPSINKNGTRILFEHGIGEGQDLYIVDDPDGDGEWEDSDGDHVADICDGYPFDPDRGYIKDDESFIQGFRFELIAIPVMIAIPIVLWRKRSK